ncbi:MAG: uracil-DNA glycosylase [Thermoanaerobaculum sp.]|nr:uracil-DNA glycosylase [Thermoanaerobaculum sp.]
MRSGDLARYLLDFGWEEVLLPGRRQASDIPADPLLASDLSSMAQALAQCQRCRLSKGRTQVVFGVGNPRARVVFVGEAPGAEEDRQGEPFVGRAGQLLNAMLRACGLARSEVYIANIVKCRPPGNRDPQDDEAAACLPFLKRQLALIKPEVIVLLGRVAARHLLGLTAPISAFRGSWRRWEGVAVLPTFHPAYLLRNPQAKRDAWEDLKQLVAKLQGGSPSEGEMAHGNAEIVL